MTRPLVAFVTTLRHPSDARDYDRIERYLAHTLRSVCAQSNPDFTVIVVCNRKPAFAGSMPRVDFVEVDFASPTASGLAASSMDAIRLDRGSKHAVALAYLRAKGGADYVMFFDADDLLSNRLVAHVVSHAGAAGFVAETGWSMRLGEPRLQQVDDFWAVNGNANILPYDWLAQNTERVQSGMSQDAICAAIEPRFFAEILGSHKFARAWLNAASRPLEPLPFPAAIWMLGNLENHSEAFGARGAVAVTPEHIAEFAIPEEYLATGIGRRIERLARRLAKLVARLVRGRR